MVASHEVHTADKYIPPKDHTARPGEFFRRAVFLAGFIALTMRLPVVGEQAIITGSMPGRTV